MEIKEIIDQKELRIFKDIEWPLEDAIHFGDSELVDFDEQEICYAAEVDGAVAGYVRTETEMGIFRIVSIIVGHKFRKRGVGKALMLKAEEKAKELGCHKMTVETGAEWEAKLFYENLGFATLVVMKNHFDHRDFVLMEKFI
jgi:GNAT superfamily N-acetyltransferase